MQQPPFMAHRQFSDSAGVEWVAYDVVPRAEERRTRHRRAVERSPEESVERRVEDRRVTVGGTRPVRLTQGWVCFEAEGARRRLQPIPANWHTLPDAELSQLLARARPATHRKRADKSADSSQR